MNQQNAKHTGLSTSTAKSEINKITEEINKLQHELTLINQIQQLTGKYFIADSNKIIDVMNAAISSKNASIFQLQYRKCRLEFFERERSKKHSSSSEAMPKPLPKMLQICENGKIEKKKIVETLSKGIGEADDERETTTLSDYAKLKRKFGKELRGHRALLEHKAEKKSKVETDESKWKIEGSIVTGIEKSNGGKMHQQFKWTTENEFDAENHAILENGFVLTRSSREDGKVKSVRALMAIPNPSKSIAFYYEANILHKSTSASSICLGFCDAFFPLGTACIGKAKNSIAIWCKRGFGVNHSFKEFDANGGKEKFNAGDVVGIGIVYPSANTKKIKCFASYNGMPLGSIYLPSTPNIMGLELFPAISLLHKGDSIRVNFGNEPWAFNPEHTIRQ